MATKRKTPSKKIELPQWVPERAVMERPARLSYVRKTRKPKGCVFCQALERGVGEKSLLLAKSQYSMVILNKYPYNTGHILVLPLRHVGDLNLLAADEYADLMILLKFAVQQVQKVYQCEGVNIGMNLGAAAGAGIPDHLHTHVVPRWRGDTNFFPLIAQTKLVVETAEQAFKKLKAHFKLNILRDFYSTFAEES